MSRVVFAETVRRHMQSVGYWFAVLTLAIIAAVLGANDGPARGWQGFVVLVAFVFGCRLIGPEFSSGTLQLILAKPVNRSVYLLSRFAGVVVALWLAIALPLLLDAIGRAFVAKNARPDWSELVKSSIATALTVMLLCALMCLFGSFTRSYNNVGIYIVLQLALGLAMGSVRMLMQNGTGAAARFLRLHPGIFDGIVTVESNLFPSASATLPPKFLALIFTNTAVALLLACLIFRRREVPYGAD